MQVNRKLSVGLFILGALSYYDKDEVINFPPIQYISNVLRKKHFPIKNGSAKQRFNKDVIALKKAMIEWEAHGSISNKAWVKAASYFDGDNAITVSALILAILRKEPEVMKWYGFNQKKLDKFQQSGGLKNSHLFSSSRVATKLLEHLDSEISYFNFNKDMDK